MTDVPAQPVANDQLDPVAESATSPQGTIGATAESAALPIKLWLPRNMAIASILLGFPGGFGLAARNAHRIGRRKAAYFILVVGALFVSGLFLSPLQLPQSAIVGINIGVVVGLYLVMREQVGAVERTGRKVVEAPGAAGLATFIGGWVATAAPAFLVLIALTFLGTQVQGVPAGSMEFGTSGSSCSVESRATTIASDKPIHFVAYLARHVKPGEVVHADLRGTAGSLGGHDTPITEEADCMSGTIPAGSLPLDTYTFVYTVGSERLASGDVVVTTSP